MNRNLIIALIIIIALAGVLISQGIINFSQNNSDKIAIKLNKTINVSGDEFRFEPNTITLNKGDAVRIVFKNDGRFPHNITIPELGVASNTIATGETTTFEFTPDRTGTFEFICTVGNHADQGMRGTFIVK